MLDKLLANKIEIPESLKKIHFNFPPAPHSGQLVLTLQGLCKSYGGPAVINGLDIVVERGERLVVAGRNGAGKSTLLRILAGVDSDYAGTVKLGTDVAVGYFCQDNAEKITGSETILERLEAKAPLALIPKLRDMLGAFLFRGDDVFKSIDVLSGGEKSRIALLELLLRPVNLLVLDEPTNHLDMHSKDVLLDALKDFGGTVVFVSHDRGFIEGLATRVLELKPGSHRIFPGDYMYYMERLEAEAAGEVPPSVAGAAASSSARTPARQSASAPSSDDSSSGKEAWEKRKQEEAERRKLEKEVSLLESLIGEAEEKKLELENSLSLPEVYSNGEKAKEVQRKITELEAELERLNADWEAAAGRL